MKNKTQKLSIIIFTDLDGTLLDHHTYSFDAAREALGKIETAHIPLIFCSSKTRAEIEFWRRKIPNQDPFVSENGGAIFFPLDWEISAPEKCLKRNGYRVIELGTAHPELIVQFKHLKNSFGEKIKGFSEMDLEQIASLTGLSKQNAKLAKMREYTEPFLFTGNKKELELLKKMVASLNLKLTRGGRFFHLMGENDKGKAVILIAEIYKKTLPEIKTVALGDGYNDLPMLRMVDLPILVQKPGGIYDENLKKIPNLRRAPGVGPEGWNQAVSELLEKT